ncbi:Phosphotransferase enzyme family protein [uncultured archaeon]|nr:Phosphotransferase enzyme family protein [uncultured archaeon]
MENEFQGYFNDKINSVKRLAHLGNNQIYRVDTKRSYLLKKYSTTQKDNWNRGKTEFFAVSNFWRIGLRNIPEPIGLFDNSTIAVYSFEPGKTLSPDEIKKDDIVSAAEFLSRLHTLPIAEKQSFPLERTSCLTIQSYVDLIKNRYNNISSDFSGKTEHRALLENNVLPKIKELENYVFDNLNGFDVKKDLPLEEQVITPGDFGFHNILVDRPNNKYTFIDFEYCGRDDPIKQILDFLHHDRTRELSSELKELFVKEYRKNTNHHDHFEKRMQLLDPVIGMNWALIYLNVLSGNYLKNTNFANGNVSEVIDERVTKAKLKLDKIRYF